MLRSIAFVLIMVGGLSASFVNPFAALMLYVWFAIFRPMEWLWVDISSLRLSLVIGIVLVIRTLASGILPDVRQTLSRGMLLFLASGLVAQTVAVRPSISLDWLDYFARLTIVTLLAVSMITSRQRFLIAMGTVAMALGFHTSKAGLASILGGGVRFFDGLAGSFSDNNAYALGAVTIMPFLLAVGQNLKGRTGSWTRVLFYASVVLSGWSVVALFSRGGFLALGASAIAFVLVQRRRWMGMLIVTAVLALMLQFAPIPEGYFSRVETIQTYEEVGEDSALGRIHFWQVAWDMALARPLGVGMKGFNSAYDQYDFSRGRFGPQRSVHSSHLQVLTENGFFGFAVWIGMFLLAFRTALHIRKASSSTTLAESDRRLLFTGSNALMISMTGFLVGGAFISSALNEITWLTFGLTAALDRLCTSMVTESPSVAATGQSPLSGTVV